MGMGGGGGSQVVYYVPTTQGAGGGGSSCSSGCDSAAAEAQKIVTPAVAKSIAGDTARAQEAQSQERQRAYGISSSYKRYKNQGQQSGNTTLGGS